MTLMLTGCHLENSSRETEPPEREIIYDEGVYHNKMWDADDLEAVDGPESNTMIDKAAAISIACAEFEKLQEKGICKEYVLEGVFFDTEDIVWIVWFGNGRPSLGGCYEIAVSKTGKILAMWPGE